VIWVERKQTSRKTPNSQSSPAWARKLKGAEGVKGTFLSRQTKRRHKRTEGKNSNLIERAKGNVGLGTRGGGRVTKCHRGNTIAFLQPEHSYEGKQGSPCWKTNTDFWTRGGNVSSRQDELAKTLLRAIHRKHALDLECYP